MYLAKFSMDYEDELCIEGFSIWHNDEYKEFKKFKELCSDKEEMYCYFGTNEYFETTTKELVNAFTIKEIDEYLALDIIDVLGKHFGTVTPSDMLDRLREYYEVHNDHSIQRYE